MVVRGMLLPRLLDCVFPCVLAIVGCCGIVLAMIGPRIIQEVVSSPVKAVIVVLLHAHSCLSLDCIGVVNEGLMCLINLVVWEAYR